MKLTNLKILIKVKKDEFIYPHTTLLLIITYKTMGLAAALKKLIDFLISNNKLSLEESRVCTVFLEDF